MKILMVVWQDATMEGGWVDREAAELIESATVCTVGFLISENNDWIKLAQTVSENQLGNLTEIPRAWIQSTQEIGGENGQSEVL